MMQVRAIQAPITRERNVMSRSIFIPFLAAAFLIAPAALPAAFAPVMGPPGFSGSAQAKTINLNSSRSNNYRKKTGNAKQPTKGGPAGLAVSDPGVPGSKPSKPKTK
jgi:hypothetical protein